MLVQFIYPVQAIDQSIVVNTILEWAILKSWFWDNFQCALYALECALNRLGLMSALKRSWANLSPLECKETANLHYVIGMGQLY